ncbi:MAG: polymorphic toxin type 17 domain-containing protein, partial [Actinomycetota bacterium]|nr:polymorphic toxin type 17 domain-containing protein [Actinomycetota bacterium]
LEAWLDDSAADVRRRAARLDEASPRRSWLSDVYPPGVAGGGCGSVLVPIAARRADGRGGDEALGEPLFASAPLQCVTTRSTSDDGATHMVAVPGGLVLAKRPKNPGGGAGAGGSGGGAGQPSKRGRLKKAMLPMRGKFRFIPDKEWDPRSPIRWDNVKKGYVDKEKNVWTKGPSRTPGQPFEWDVQLDEGSNWRKFSKDGKHLNVTLDGRISH